MFFEKNVVKFAFLSKKYKVYVLDKDYKNCVYCWKPSDEATEEVYITNLEVSE